MTTEERTIAHTIFGSPDDLLDAVGVDLGVTPWAVVEPAAMDDFARATGTPATGDELPPMMVLSLTNRLLPDLMEVRGVSSGVNYGTGAVRFPAPVSPRARIRASGRLIEAVEVRGGVQTTVEITVETEGSPQPACVVESLSRWMR